MRKLESHCERILLELQEGARIRSAKCSCLVASRQSHLLFQLLLDHFNRVGGNEKVCFIEVLNEKVSLLVHDENQLLDGRVAVYSLERSAVQRYLNQQATYVVMRTPAVQGEFSTRVKLVNKATNSPLIALTMLPEQLEQLRREQDAQMSRSPFLEAHKGVCSTTSLAFARASTAYQVFARQDGSLRAL
jgi:hypothetical protein